MDKVNPWFTLGIFLSFAQLISSQYVDMRSVSEGNCPYNGFPVSPNLNSTWFENTQFSYVSAGSKYHLYRISTGATRISQSFFVPVVEHEFPYTACIQSQVNHRAGQGAIYSKGQLIDNYKVSRPTNDATLIDFTPVPQLHRDPRYYDVARHYVTYTDNYSFIVFANCWTRSNQQTWDVISTTPYLPPQTRNLILNHIQSLGFDRRLAVFLEYDRCSRH